MTSEEELEALATRIVSWCLGPHSLYPDAAKFAEAESRVRTSLSELIRQRDEARHGPERRFNVTTAMNGDVLANRDRHVRNGPMWATVSPREASISNDVGGVR